MLPRPEAQPPKDFDLKATISSCDLTESHGVRTYVGRNEIGRKPEMQPLVQIGLVALGSALGGLARWGVGVGAARVLGSAFPYGTFLINLSGSFFLGWFLTALTERSDLVVATWIRPDHLRLAIAVGFAGAYTTFSTFEWEAHGMLRDGAELAGVLYMIGSLLLGLVAIRLGMIAARYV